LEEGNNSLKFAVVAKGSDEDRQFRAQSAVSMYKIALDCRPESYRGLEGLALSNLVLGNKQDAVKYALAAMNAAPTQPSPHFTYAAMLRATGMHHEAYDQTQVAA